jgi:hypothetical protein
MLDYIQGGTLVNGVPDDTEEAQGSLTQYGALLLGPKTYYVRPLDLTDTFGAMIRGVGYRSLLIPIEAHQPVLDLAGASHPLLSTFRIEGQQSAPPLTAILSAQKDGSYSSDAIRIENVRIDGYYDLAAHFDLGVASSSVIGSQFYNYTAAGKVVIHTSNNFFGAHSKFKTIATQTDKQPSDWTYTQSEIHDLGGVGGIGLALFGCRSIRYLGGNISSSGQPVSNNAAMNGSITIYPGDVSFMSTDFYADFNPQPICHIKNNAGSAGVPHFYGYAVNPVVG